MEVPIENGGADRGLPPPPSPLTGCYLLIVVGEPHTEDHKDIILQRIAKGLLSWDASSCHVDLEKELTTITEQAPEGEEARHGERLIQFASENLVTEILIHPASSTLIQCARNLLSSFTRHRHIIHAGYTFAANGSWILQDGTFSLADLSEALQEIEVQRVMRAYENTISIDVHCSPEGNWCNLSKESYVRSCKLRLNPNDVLTSGSAPIAKFINYLSPFLYPADVTSLLESSDVVGNIRFSHPTLYVFPGGQGDAALFGINGFNMLLDGGFSRKACFWDFARHLDRLDAVLMTRLNNSNLSGINAVLRRKRANALYPQIGHFFCNIQERRTILSPDGDKDKDPLLVNLLEQGHEIVDNLRALNLRPQACYRDSEPINLYHKVGHGTLDMYVLSPAKDSKEVKEFLQKWNNNDPKLFCNPKDGKDFTFPLQNLISICALLVWKPANSNDTITRILYPGSTPQHKIFEGLERLKHLEFMKHPVCSSKTISASSSIIGLKSKQVKTNGVEKILSSEKTQKSSVIENKNIKEKPKGGQKISENGFKGAVNENNVNETKATTKVEPIKKSDSTESEKVNGTSIETKKTEINGKDNVENEIKKVEDKFDTKAKPKAVESKTKTEHKSKIDSKQSVKAISRTNRSIERKSKPSTDKKPSPTTPKKSIDSKAVDSSKDKPKTPIKLGPKSSPPNGTPAKSAKDANNRKVVESKYKPIQKKEVHKPIPDKKEVKVERRPISRRPKATASPGRAPGSPAKIKPMSLPVKTKLEKEATTDSSTVSTPSADQDTTIKKIDDSKLSPEELEQMKAQELADLKEEQEVVNEIEAVFRKGEQKGVTENGAVRAIMTTSIIEQSLEPQEEEEEYLIVEKEEIDQLDEQDSSLVKDESEIQKHLRDSEESEKKRNSDETDKKDDIEGGVELIEADSCKVLEIISPEKKTEDTTPADTKKEAKDKVEETSKDQSMPSPEEKPELSSEKKTTETRDVDEEEVKDLGDQNCALESQPDEKFSTTVESGATTAPTLPEDERIPLDEIKEDQVIEEKHVKEETKEKEITEIVVTPEKVVEALPKLPVIAGIKFDTKHTHIRDIVKTPDEVADLPMHEEADYQTFDGDYKQEDKKLEKSKEPTKEDIKFAATNVVIEEKLEQAADDILVVPNTSTDVIPTQQENEVIGVQPCESPRKPEIVTIDSKNASPLKGAKSLPIDKHELGSKSPKEREQDVALIVASVAEVLKSDAPLEEIEYVQFYPPSTLRETHITTVESPVADVAIEMALKSKEGISSIATSVVPEEKEPEEEFNQIKTSVEIPLKETKIDTQEATVTECKSPEPEKDIQPVKCMLVTASSEDGGEETVICPTGSITFVNGSEHKTDIFDEKDKLKMGDAEIIETITKEADTPIITSGKTSPDVKQSLEDSIDKKDSSKVSSGKATPDIIKHDIDEISEKNIPVLPTKEEIEQLSGKSSPDVKSGQIKGVDEIVKGEESPNILSGKTTPDVKQDVVDLEREASKEPSGKSTPDVKLDSIMLEKGSSNVTSEKLTPDVKHDDAVLEKEESKEPSGKSTPDVKQDDTVLEKEASKEPSGKSTPDVKHDSIMLGKESSKVPSGKSTPDVKHDDTILEKEASKEASGKSTPDVKHDSIMLEKESSKVPSGKSTPDVKHDDTILEKEASKEASGKSTPDVKHGSIILEKESSKVPSGKSTPDVKHDDTILEKEASKEASGKSTPDVKHDSIMLEKESSKVPSGKSTPDVKHDDTILEKEESKEPSGKSTPDVKQDDTVLEKEASKEPSGKSTPDVKHDSIMLEKEASKEPSGKSTPDVKQDDTVLEKEASKEPSGKSTPDVKLDSIMLEKGSSNVTSGKSTPDVKHDSIMLEKEASKVPSGKSTPDVKQDDTVLEKEASKEPSGKSTPDVKHDSIMLEKEASKVPSGKSTPDVKHDDTILEKEESKEPSGKSTPDVKQDDTVLEKEESKEPSGKSTPDVKHDSIMLEKEESKEPSGKSTPDVKQDDTVLEKEASKEPSEKSTPDVKHDDTMLEKESSKVPSGKSTPEIKRDDINLEQDISKQLSGKSTPDIKHDSIILENGASKGLSGKSTPELKLSGDTLEINSPKELSGKSTPDIKSNMKEAAILETEEEASGKSTPDIKLVETLQCKDSPKTASGNSTPDIKTVIVKDATIDVSGKSTPEIMQHSENEIKSLPEAMMETSVSDFDKNVFEKQKIESPKELSGKTTPEIKSDANEPISSVIKDSPKDFSGKSTPDIAIEEDLYKNVLVAEALKDLSGKSTPDMKSEDPDKVAVLKKSEEINDSFNALSGKSTPDIKLDTKETESLHIVKSSKDASGKSTPDINDSDILDSAKAVLKDISGKTTPEVAHLKEDSPKMLSGKTTPDIKIEPIETEKVKDTSLEAGDIEDIPKELSSELSPGIEHDFTLSDAVKDSATQKALSDESITVIQNDLENKESAKEILGKFTPEVKDIDTLESPKQLSGKSTPDIKTISGKSSPDMKHDVKDISGKSTPEVKDNSAFDSKDSAKETSGKSTPDIKLNAKVESLEVKDSLKDVSGKTTPEIAEIPKDLSGKSTPDVKDKIIDSLDMKDTCRSVSGKSTPEPIKHELSSNIIDDSVKGEKLNIETDSPIPSGKTTPDIKQEAIACDGVKVLSGKSSPSGTKEGDKLEIASNISGTSTPEPKSDISEICKVASSEIGDVKESDKISPKEEKSDLPEKLSTLITGSIDDKLDAISSISGKSSPDPKQKDTDNVEIDSIHTSGIASPSINDDTKEEDNLYKIGNKIELPEKSVPLDLQESENQEVLSIVSGKSSPDLKLKGKVAESLTDISGKSTPEIIDSSNASQVLSGKSTPVIIQEITHSALATSGKSTPDIKHIEKDSPKELSGKSTPDIKAGDSTERDTPQIPELSGKSTPEIKVTDVNTDINFSEQLTQNSNITSSQTNVSIKSSTDVQDSKLLEKVDAKTAPTTEIQESNLKEDEVKSTLHELSEMSSDDIKLEEKSIAGGESSPDPSKLSGESTPDVKVEEKTALSGKATPDIVDDNKAVLSGKTTPEAKLDDKEGTEKTTSDVQNISNTKLDTPDKTSSETKSADVVNLSGKSTPDMKDEGKSLLIGNKVTPDVHDLEIKPAVSEKSTSDIKMEKSDSSGKTTPDIGELKSATPDKASPDNKQDEKLTSSDKATPEKLEAVPDFKDDNKATVIEDDDKLNLSGRTTTDTAQYGEKSDLAKIKMTEIKTDEAKSDVSGKSTPEIKQEEKPGLAETLQKGESTPLSGKGTPIPDDKHDAGMSKETEQVKLSGSGKSTPDLQKVQKITEKMDDSISVISNLSGKSTPDFKSETNVVKSVMDFKETKPSELQHDKPMGMVNGNVYDTEEDLKENGFFEKSHSELSEKTINESKQESKVIANVDSSKTQQTQKEITSTKIEVESSRVTGDISEKITDSSKISVTSITEFSEAGPSHLITKDSPPSASSASPSANDPMDTSTDNLCLSGKSTPDIADVEHLKETALMSSSQTVETTKHVLSSLKTEVRSSTPGSDDFDQGVSSPPSDMSSGQMSRAPHPWGPASSDEKQGYSDDEDVPDSPMSTTSQIAHSPLHQMMPKDGHMDLMSASFYGELPDTDISYQTALDEHLQARGDDIMTRSISPGYLHSITTAQYSSILPETETSADSVSLSHLHEITKARFSSSTTTTETEEKTSDIETVTSSQSCETIKPKNAVGEDDNEVITGSVHETLEESRSHLHELTKAKIALGILDSECAATDEDVEQESRSHLHEITKAKFVAGAIGIEDVTEIETCEEESRSHLHEVTKAKFVSGMVISSNTEDIQIQENIEHGSTSSQSKNHLYELTLAKYATGVTSEQSEELEDPIKSWGKPLGLPSPAPMADNKGTPKKERKITSNLAIKNKMNDDRRRSESPGKGDKKAKKLSPVYVDLAYVPHHGNSNYSFADFFKKVRARYYVFSGIEPSKEVYDALLEAKQTWEDKELEVTIIPTYDTDVLGYWVSENEDILAKCKIDLSPSASRCTINLQDHETSCSAYRLEF